MTEKLTESEWSDLRTMTTADGTGAEMKTCECVQAHRDGSQTTCGKPATHQAYEHPPIYFCAQCCHDCIQDASPYEQSTVVELLRL